MTKDDPFLQQLISAFDSKAQWYETEVMAKILDEYRSFLSVVQNLISLLQKKGYIQPDPYKLETKISDISVPSDAHFLDSERASVLGARLSEYESMLDFVCNMFKFSLANLTVDRIKKFLALNSFISWTALTPSSPRSNTRALGEIVSDFKASNDPLSASVANESVSQCGKLTSSINSLLKDVTDFQKEVFKMDIRKKVYPLASFSMESASADMSDAFQQIKRGFSQAFDHRTFYPELAEELVKEDFGPSSEGLHKALMAKFEIQNASKEKKTASINTKELLMEAVRSLSAISPLLDTIISKVEDNHELLESEQQTFWNKLVRAFRKAFNIAEKPVEYKVTVTEPLTQTHRQETIAYQKFVEDMTKKSRLYLSFSVKKAGGYQKLEAQEEPEIQEYLAKQITECNKTLILLNALDDFFKSAPKPENRQKVKGLKMELTALKNAIVKTNQRKAEYTSYVDEAQQMKRLGIKNV